MIDYKKYELNDFLNDDSFLNWVVKSSIEESAFWEKWLVENPEKSDLINEAKIIALNIKNSFEDITDQEVDLATSYIVQAIEKLPFKTKRNRVISLFESHIFKVAASIIIVLGIGTFLFLTKNQNNEALSSTTQNQAIEKPFLITKRNTTEKPLLITLPDNSSVILQKNSSISFLNSFDEIRKVSLTGGAFFEVKKNPSSPFYVHANNIIAKVVGTSFTVKAFENDSLVKVIVKTGKVRIFNLGEKDVQEINIKEDNSGYLLLPNKQFVLNRIANDVICSTVELPDIQEFNIQIQAFEFKKTPIAEVFKVLEKSYGITIEIQKIDIRDIYITASLGDEPLLIKLDILCRIIDGKLIRRENKILITAQNEKIN